MYRKRRKEPKDSAMELSKEKRVEGMKLAKVSKEVTNQQRRTKLTKRLTGESGETLRVYVVLTTK